MNRHLVQNYSFDPLHPLKDMNRSFLKKNQFFDPLCSGARKKRKSSQALNINAVAL